MKFRMLFAIGLMRFTDEGDAFVHHHLQHSRRSLEEGALPLIRGGGTVVLQGQLQISRGLLVAVEAGRHFVKMEGKPVFTNAVKNLSSAAKVALEQGVYTANAVAGAVNMAATTKAALNFTPEFVSEFAAITALQRRPTGCFF